MSVCRILVLGLALPVVAAAEPRLAYRSAFEGYQPYADAEQRSWRDANETVRQAGGWRAYAREAQGAARPASAAASAANHPHAGHEKK